MQWLQVPLEAGAHKPVPLRHTREAQRHGELADQVVPLPLCNQLLLSGPGPVCGPGPGGTLISIPIPANRPVFQGRRWTRA
jgi:hypothetical protein